MTCTAVCWFRKVISCVMTVKMIGYLKFPPSFSHSWFLFAGCPVSGGWEQTAVFCQCFTELSIFRNTPEIQCENISTSSAGKNECLFCSLKSLDDGWVNIRLWRLYNKLSNKTVILWMLPEILAFGLEDEPVFFKHSHGADKRLILCASRKVCHVICHQSK